MGVSCLFLLTRHSYIICLDDVEIASVGAGTLEFTNINRPPGCCMWCVGHPRISAMPLSFPLSQVWAYFQPNSRLKRLE